LAAALLDACSDAREARQASAADGRASALAGRSSAANGFSAW